MSFIAGPVEQPVTEDGTLNSIWMQGERQIKVQIWWGFLFFNVFKKQSLLRFYILTYIHCTEF